MKTCRKCEEPQPSEAFHRNASRADGLSNWCKKCKKEHNSSEAEIERRAAWAKTAKGQASRRKMKSTPESKRSELIRQRRIKYGITDEQLAALTTEQGGLCGSCGLEPQGLGPRGRPAVLCVDHDHVTSVVRGLLCPPCNFALGLLRDNYDTILGLAAYLKRSIQRTSTIAAEPSIIRTTE